MSDETNRTVKFLEARLTEQDKLIAHLEHKNDNLKDRNRNLVEKNNNQVETIKDLKRRNDSQYADFRNYQSKIDEQRQSIRDWMKLTDELRAEVAGLENRLTEALIGHEAQAWEEIQADRTKLRTKVAELVATDLNHRAENVGAVRMVAKIVDAMQAEGFDIAGWGNDDQLIELEGVADRLNDATETLIGTLDAIRTERE